MTVIHEQAAAANLTARERQVFDLIGRRYGSQQVAQRLGISVGTAETHRARIIAKLEIESTCDLRKIACAALTAQLRDALKAAVGDLQVVADMAGHSTPAGAYALQAIARVNAQVLS